LKEPNNKGAGKGDKPRGGFSRRYKDNYDVINWGDADKCRMFQMQEKVRRNRIDVG